MTALQGPIAAPVPAPAVTEQRASSSFWHAAWYRYRRNKLAMASGVLVMIIVFTGAFAPWLAPYSETHNDLLHTLAGPAGTTCSGPTSLDGTR